MLPSAWHGGQAWRVLDTAFGDGISFLSTWQAWAEDTQRPRLLHYVALAPVAPGRDALLHMLRAFPTLAEHAPDVTRQWFGLLPGFHRIALQGGQVLLTLCIGPLQTMLREQQFVADCVYLGQPKAGESPSPWERWSVKALARLCRRGTTLGAVAATPELRDALTQAGFVLDENPAGAAAAEDASPLPDHLQGRYQPRWEPGSSRTTWRASPCPASSCVVVGAGLAGAAVAAALAHRGWQVTVLDAAGRPAAGASGLPVGLLAPAVSRDDNTRSRLSRAGVRFTLQACRHLLQQGEDWSRSGVLEMRPHGTPVLPAHWSIEGTQWSAEAPDGIGRDTWGTAVTHRAPALWHTSAGWVKPARLVQACLDRPGVRFVGHGRVESICCEDGIWVLRDEAGRVLARAPQLVLANAGDAVRLANGIAGPRAPDPVQRLAAMPTLSGQVSWALHQHHSAGRFPPFPVNGLGSFVAYIPMAGAAAWFTGATYERPPNGNKKTWDGPAFSGEPAQPHYSEATAHQENLDRIAQLLPSVAACLGGTFSSGQVHAWRGVRCTTADRLPAVGPLQGGPQPGLWISAGMGSRGLTYAVLCAELIAAQLGGEPLPVEASLLKSLSASRVRLQAG